LAEHEPVFDCKVLIFDVAKVTKPAEQCLLKVRVGGGREIAETRILGLLRAPHERPRRRRAAEQRNELASFPLTKMHPLPVSRVTAHRIGRDQVSGDRRCRAASYRCNGLKADAHSAFQRQMTRSGRFGAQVLRGRSSIEENRKRGTKKLIAPFSFCPVVRVAFAMRAYGNPAFARPSAMR
jgi:hypothetical protein